MAKTNGNPQAARATTAEFAGAKDFADFYAGYGKWFGEVGKLFTGRPLTFDVAALIEVQRKNLEALTNANKLAIEGAQAVAKRQAEILRQAVQDFSGLTRELVAEGTPEEKLARQADFAKGTFEQAVANFEELSELAQKSGAQALAIINKRIAENFDDVKSALARGTAK
ncbi:MAG: TIGR01841 family phasin [Rhodospirillaceae bacterium]|nr:TIGR01841 family phasin [Rhodospirillaceae bacterium]